MEPARAPRTVGQRTGVTHQQEGQNATDARHMILIDQMIAWQIANPGQPWTKCAIALGLSALWCRMIASTDAFKARYRDQAPELLKEVGIATLKEKMAAATEIALERLAEKAVVSESMSDLTDMADVLLKHQYGDGKSLGAAPAAINQTIILQARESIIDGVHLPTKAGNREETPAIEAEVVPIREDETLPHKKEAE